MFGEGSFVESALGRITLVVLFTTVVGLALFLLFLVNRVVSPMVLKYTLVAAVGLGAGFNARRLFIERNFIFRLLTAAFAIFIALGVLNVFSQGFIGLNLLRAYTPMTEWDGPLSFGLAFVFAWLALRGWTSSSREIVVEPRTGSAPVTIVEPASQPRRRATRRVPGSLASSFASFRQRAADRISRLAPAAPRETAKKRKTTRTKTKTRSKPARRRGAAVHLSGVEEHVCPYCLEQVVKNDRRGVKVCKVCKTWHHGDCWAITGVCQVPHQYVN
jgi:ribosomal protein L37AE/L43A